MPRARVFSGTAATPAKTPVKIPLNDDRQEKANRLHSRQAQHELHMSQIKAAATPVRKRRSLLGQSPRTPGDGEENDLPSIAGTAVTPMKRVPILANFEEWMKMATDNKINATNSWNFALIDYFHDMSLLKEGDGVNFQRASCTLDGCVKIYTNRVDSVATETGKLLSGLADSNTEKRNDDEAEDGEEDEDEDGTKKRSKKRVQRSSETTLATSFSQLQLKKMELEFAIDPLFKKASADFDEGGAKGLLLNHLSIDGSGRIVFDSSDDIQDEVEDNIDPEDSEIKRIDEHQTIINIDLESLGAKFLPNLSLLDTQDICPSLKTFELGNGDGSLDLPFLKAPEGWKQESGANTEAQNTILNPAIPAFDDDDNLLGGLDLVDDVGFGEGGEAWAKEVALEPQLRLHHQSHEDAYDSDGAGENIHDENDNARYTISMRHGASDEQQNILDYFDKTLRSNWAGPEHWKIRKVKDAAKVLNQLPTKRKEREPFEIDFFAPISQQLADALYTPAAANSTISLPRSQWKSKTRNLLPDDKHFSSRQLLRLFLKPNASLGKKKSTGSTRIQVSQSNGIDVDEEYWARRQEGENDPAQGEDGEHGNYDANFFQDDGFNVVDGIPDDEDDEFADARDHFSPEADGVLGIVVGTDGKTSGSQEGAFGAQIVTQSRRLRPEYVQYAKVAKKVDVRKLKEEIWKGLAFEQDNEEKISVLEDHEKDKALNFTEVVNGLKSVYPKQAMADISTSFCFICVLHLANEKGLVINNHEDFQELTIRKDPSAEIVGIEA